MKQIVVILILMTLMNTESFEQMSKFKSDTIVTSAGMLNIMSIGRSSLLFEFNGKYIYTDPLSALTDYSLLPKADIILITHFHPENFDTNAINLITKESTEIVLTKTAHDLFEKGTIMENGTKNIFAGFEVEAVPAYNITPGQETIHPKGRDNGYIVTFGDKRVYVSGDTEDTPELEALKNIDVAFLSLKQPYTMTPEQAAQAAIIMHPHILYPYEYDNTDILKLQILLKNKGVKIHLLK